MIIVLESRRIEYELVKLKSHKVYIQCFIRIITNICMNNAARSLSKYATFLCLSLQFTYYVPYTGNGMINRNLWSYVASATLIEITIYFLRNIDDCWLRFWRLHKYICLHISLSSGVHSFRHLENENVSVTFFEISHITYTSQEIHTHFSCSISFCCKQSIKLYIWM
jgi:hypothetical protein